MLVECVVDFAWVSGLKKSGMHARHERIMISYDPLGTLSAISFEISLGRKKSVNDYDGWSADMQIAVSDDFFITKKVLVQSGNKFLLTN